MFKDYSDEIMNEILGGANGSVDKAGDAIAFMDRITFYITDFIRIIKEFFAGIAAALGM